MADDLIGLAEQLEREIEAVGVLPVCPGWMYASIRHCVRNLDFDVGEGFNEPDRYAGGPIAAIINLVPEIIAALRASGDQQ